jgi:transketolase
MRNHFAKILHETMVKDDNVFLLYGDIGNRLFDQIKSDFPKRIENAGVAEASMVGIAAGLSQAGYLPVCYTINSFLYLKALEQIKLDLAYPARKVVLVGTGGGLSYGSLGTSHHSIEDYAVLGSIPNLNLYSPADSIELESNLQDALENDGPSYLRIGKKGERPLMEEGIVETTQQGPGRLISGAMESKNAVVSVGTIGWNVKEAIEKLGEEFNLDFIALSKIRPWETDLIRARFGKYEKILVVEEHVQLSGVASLFLATFADQRKAPQITSAALPREFFTGLGGQESIREHNGLDVQGLVEKIRSIF